MTKTQAWLHSFRLRTLPLALSGIILGSFLAILNGHFSYSIFVLAIFTTLFLQTLSNLANDYGDFASGADNAERVGPQRGMQQGLISPKEMKKMVILFAILSFISGLALLFSAFSTQELIYILAFLVLGIAAIIAALRYTTGKNPYGYRGRGDFFVFLFFGLVSVAGSYYLYAHHFSWQIFLPAASVGLFSTGVLNINNMRDRENDQKVGKITIPVKLGKEKAKFYHYFLIHTGWLLSMIFLYNHFHSWWNLLALISFPLFMMHTKRIKKAENMSSIDPELKKLSLSTLLYALTFGAALLF